MPDIVRQLTLSQSATFVNVEGVTVRVTADPKEHSFRFEEGEDDDALSNAEGWPVAPDDSAPP